MNQTTAIIGGGILVIVTAVLLYVYTGGDTPKDTLDATVAAETISVETPITESSTTSPMTPVNITQVKQPTMESKKAEETNAVLHTSVGDITVKFDTADAPKTVENFLKLTRSNFYNGVRFHRVIKDFMIQAGDPLSKDNTQVNQWGTGGPGYKFADEINAQGALYQKGYKRGVLAMANSGPNTNGSQFFIMHKDYALPPLYTIFGEVVSGLDVVDTIATTPTGANDRPVTPVTIKSVEVQ